MLKLKLINAGNIKAQIEIKQKDCFQIQFQEDRKLSKILGSFNLMIFHQNFQIPITSFWLTIIKKKTLQVFLE